MSASKNVMKESVEHAPFRFTSLKVKRGKFSGAKKNPAVCQNSTFFEFYFCSVLHKNNSNICQMCEAFCC